MQPQKIILYGPPVSKSIENGYGGGTGGYTRNMGAYLNFEFDEFKLVPLFHTVRGELQLGKLTFLYRFIVDFFRMISGFFRVRPEGIHILAQYRTATPREFALSLAASLFRIPYLYEIKAGAFISFYQSTGLFNKKMLRCIVVRANVVLCEGAEYVPFLLSEFGKSSEYFPNFVLSSEIPSEANIIFNDSCIRILFVGFCTNDKGVFELVDGACSFAREVSSEVVLTLVGSEDEKFSNYLENLSDHPNLTIRRMGRLAHADVLSEMARNDIYCYPSRHSGEGHNNSINEAMMFGMVILSSRAGFLEYILGDDCAYYVNEVSSTDICRSLNEIVGDKGIAQKKGTQARTKLISSYTQEVLYRDLERHYKNLVG